MNQNQLISPLPDIPVRIYEVPETEKSGLFNYIVKQEVTRGKFKPEKVRTNCSKKQIHELEQAIQKSF